jgi:hypothetical protein
MESGKGLGMGTKTATFGLLCVKSLNEAFSLSGFVVVMAGEELFVFSNLSLNPVNDLVDSTKKVVSFCITVKFYVAPSKACVHPGIFSIEVKCPSDCEAAIQEFF